MVCEEKAIKLFEYCIEHFHSCGKQLCKFIGTKENVYIRKEFKSYRISLVHQHGCSLIVLEHKYGHRDIM